MSQSKDRGVKEPNTTQMAMWARKAHSHVSKSFVMSRLDFGQGVWKGGFLQAVGSDTNL